MGRIVTVDFETEAIEDRPKYPPEPVGVAIKDGARVEYLAWGHPTGNNCTRADARRRLADLWRGGLLFHNAAFDLEVAAVHLGLRPPPAERFDDTLVLAYLSDPRQHSLSLKPMAERILGMPPEEQSELRDWILANVPAAKKKPTTWGAYIARAPGGLVARYAKGDVVRTEKLYRHFLGDVLGAGMAEAYAREKRHVLLKLKLEGPGLRVAPRLVRELPRWRRAHADLERGICRRLGTPGLNVGSGEQLADALIRKGKLREIEYTEKGNVRTSREVLERNCSDAKLLELLALHSVLSTYLGTFIEPWVRSYEENDGLIYPTYNSVRSTDEYGGRGGVGTRTGRYSSSNPNFENIPANVEESKHRTTLLRLQRHLREYGIRFIGLRDYIVPREGCVFISRDYDQQELRILAHYEDGELLARYLADPRLDVHEFVRQEIRRMMSILYERKHVKGTVFGTIYGMGVPKLSGQVSLPLEEAARLKKAVLGAVPGMKWLDDELQNLAREGRPMYTWGGRRYYAEEDAWVKEDGSWRRRRFWYKLLNLLIQGSAADATKTAMVQIDEACDPDLFRMLIPIHDEVLAEADAGHAQRQSRLMKEAMEDLNFDLPMTTSAKMGPRSWARLKEVKE